VPWLGIAIALALWFTYDQLRNYWEQPQAVLVLGGSTERERFAAEFARQHPDLPIWVSGGSTKAWSEQVFAKAGVQGDRVHLDYQAIDTVTNFTTVVDQLKAQDIHSIYLITSDYHMRRARIIGEIILGSRGISFKPVAIPSQRPAEPLIKALGDGSRALLWVTTGSTGANFSQALKSYKTDFLEQLPNFKRIQSLFPELKHKAERSRQ
jgi:uncharacterized SAM-binding protein YcdF (DUF218 family)